MRSQSIRISTIADVIKIWKKGILYRLSTHQKVIAKKMVMEEINKITLNPAQASMLETLRNVLEG
jgi:hypothetical protein